MSYCKKCGSELQEGVEICTSCGTNQNEEATAVEATSAVNDADRPKSVTFGEAIKLFFTNYVNFTGRASKSEYWWAFLFQFIVGIVAGFIPVLGSLVSLALIIPNLSVSVRRLHDTGKAWYYWLLGLIPLAGFIIMIVLYCKDSDGDNQWGPGPLK